MTDYRAFNSPYCTTFDNVRTFIFDVFKIVCKCPPIEPMTDSRAFDGSLMGPSYTLYFCTFIPFLCFSASLGTNYFSLHVKIAPKHDCVDSRWNFKSVSPSNQLIISSDDEREPESVPLGARTPTQCTQRSHYLPV